MALLIALLTFAVAIAVCLLVWFALSVDDNQTIIRRRMDAVRRAEARRPGDLSVRLLRDEMLSGVPALNRLMMGWSWPRKFRDLVLQAGMTTRPGKILLTAGVLAFASFLVTSIVYNHFPAPVLTGLLIGAIPIANVLIKRRRRLRKFEENFPEAIDLLNRSIRAGHPFTTGIGMIATESPEPIAGEFRTTFEEQNFGLPLRDVLQNLSERVPLIDVRFFVTALLVQKETGGNLSEILENLSHVIRDRFRIYREVRVKSAQGRLMAVILIAMPPFLILGMRLVNPSYTTILFEDRIGFWMLWGAGTFQVVGSLLLWKIIHIEV